MADCHVNFDIAPSPLPRPLRMYIALEGPLRKPEWLLEAPKQIPRGRTHWEVEHYSPCGKS